MIMRSRFGTLAFLIAAGAALSAQEVTGTVTGTVRDGKGNPVGAVALNLTSVGGVQSRTLSTDAQGSYRVPLLLPGEYILTATKDGYITAKAEFRVSGGGVVRQDIDLKAVGTTSAIVEVVSTAAQVDKTQTKTAATFTQDDFATIPLAGSFVSRGLAGLALAPGVSGPNQLYQSVRGGGQGQAQYLVNGLSVRDNITMQGRPQDVILDDLIEESQIILSPLNAKNGDSSAGLINIVERTGGNQFTGSMRVKMNRNTWTALRPQGYNRNGLIAGTFEPSPVDDLNRSYEIAITGPIIKDVLTFTYGTRLTPTAQSSVPAGPAGVNSYVYFQGAVRHADPYDGGFLPDANYPNPSSPNPKVLSGPTKSTFHQGRLYWQINQNHSLDYSHVESANYFFDFNGGNFPTLDTTTDTDQHSINRFRQLTYRGMLGANQILEIRYGKRESTIKFDSGPGDPINLWYGPSTVASLQNGVAQWGVNGATADHQPELRNTEAGTLNYQLFVEAAGSHSFDIGVNWIKTIWGTVQNSGGPNSQIFYSPGKLYAVDDTALTKTLYGPDNGFIVFPWTASGTGGMPVNPNYFTYMQQFTGVSQATLNKPTTAYYINDLWQFNTYLSLMAGLRYEKFTYGDGKGEKYKSHTLSPRTELKWDLGGDQKRILSLSYGEFRGNVGERITRQFSTFRNTTIITRFWTPTNPGGPQPDYVVTKAQLLNPANYGYVFSFDVPDAIYAIDHGFKPERNKEIVFGFRRSYTAGGYLSLNLVNRTWDDLPQSYGSINPITIQDPTGSGLPAKINYLRTLVNDPEAKRRYKALEMEFKLPLLNSRASLQGSYTYGRLTANSNYGDFTAFGSTQTLASTGLFRDQFHALGIGSNRFEPDGPLPTSSGNSVKLLGVYRVQRGKLSSTFSLNARYQDGAPENATITTAIPGSTFTGAFVSGLNPGFSPGVATVLPRTYANYWGGRGEYTSPHTVLYDFGYSLQLPMTNKVMLFSELQVVNVFNHIYPSALNRTSSPLTQGTPTNPIVDYRISSAASYGYPTSFTSFTGARSINLNFGMRF